MVGVLKSEWGLDSLTYDNTLDLCFLVTDVTALLFFDHNRSLNL